MVLFGGYDPATGLCADTWQWDGVDWVQHATAVAPPARMFAAMAFDRVRGVATLFGGTAGGTSLLQDTWRWNGQVWTQVATATTPPARSNATMAFDGARAEVVMFGGLGSGGVLADTWISDGADWAPRSSPVSPPARQAAPGAFDFVRGTIVMFGGADAAFTTNLGDCWEWDGSEWRARGGGPSARHGACLAYDAARGATVLFGGRSGTFHADTWSLPSLDAAGSREWVLAATLPSTTLNAMDQGSMIYDQARSELIMHGGSYVNGPPPWSPGGSYTWGTHGSTRRWNGTTWVVVANGPARAGAGFVYDSPRARAVLFGGYSGGQPFPFVDQADTWAWDGTTWTQIAAGGPSARRAPGMAYDAARDRVVLFGGSTGNTVFADTWEWDGATWVQRAPVSSPPGRAWMAMVWDPGSARVVLHGGRSGAVNLGDTWEYDGTTWMAAAGTSPSARSNHAMVFDSVRNRLVLFGGFGAPLADTWERVGSQWTEVPRRITPTQRYGHTMAYDAGRQCAVVAFGLQTFGAFQFDTWEDRAQPITGATVAAHVLSYGQGCGTPTMRIVPVAGVRPVIGGSARTRITTPVALPNSPMAAVALGFSSASTSFGSLPWSLAVIGAPGCFMWQSADLSTWLIPRQVGTFEHDFTLTLPVSTALLGVHVYAQAWAPYAASVVVSNAIDWQLGNL